MKFMYARAQAAGVEFVEIAGARLEYRWIEARDPDAATLVFLHEGLGCLDAWREFPARLCAATGFAGLVYSRQGYGRSDAALAPRPVSYLHREAHVVLPRLLQTLGVGRHVLFGHSDGASIALLYAGAEPREGLEV